MAYRIEYGPPIPARYRKADNPQRLQVMTATCLLLFIMIVKAWFPAGVQKLQQILLPGTPSATQQALDTLVTDMRRGETFGDAFTAFCEEIIDHDQTVSG